MTREEIVEGLKLLEDNMVYFDELQNDKGEWIDVHELLFEAISALEQQKVKEIQGIMEGGWTVSFEIPKQEPCETSTDEPMTMVYPTIFCEDAIKKLKEQPAQVYIDNTDYQRGYIDGVNQMIKELKAEQQKPIECEDAISREDVIDKIRHAEINFTITSSIDFSEYKREIQEIVDHIVEAQINAIRQLPSVTPIDDIEVQDLLIDVIKGCKGELYKGEFGEMESSDDSN